MKLEFTEIVNERHNMFTQLEVELPNGKVVVVRDVIGLGDKAEEVISLITPSKEDGTMTPADMVKIMGNAENVISKLMTDADYKDLKAALKDHPRPGEFYFGLLSKYLQSEKTGEA